MKYGEKLTKEVRHQLVMLPWYSVFDNLAYKVEATSDALRRGDSANFKVRCESVVKSIEGVTTV